MKKLIALVFTLICAQTVIFGWGKFVGYEQIYSDYPLTRQVSKIFKITDNNEIEFLKAIEDGENITSYLETIKNPSALIAGAKIAAEKGYANAQSEISKFLTMKYKARS